MKRAILFVLILALAGCETVVASFKPAKTSDLEVGKTTYEQAVSQLGKPTDESKLPDGRRVVTYLYRVQGQTLHASTSRGGVSGLRTSSGQYVADTSTFEMTFDPGGVLQSYTWGGR